MLDVHIRPLCEEDAKTSYKWRNNQEIWRFTGSRPAGEVTIDDELAWIRRVIADRTCKRFAIMVDEVYVGNIYLTDIKDGIAEYHLFIGEVDYWGKGIARLASEQILVYARKVLKLHTIELGVRKENIVALKLYHSLKFKKYAIRDGLIRMKLELPNS